LKDNPARISADEHGDAIVVALAKEAVEQARLHWRETNYLLLRRGPYVVAAGLDETIAGEPKELRGKFVNLFDPELTVRDHVKLAAGSRFLLLDLAASSASELRVLASACKALPAKPEPGLFSLIVEGVAKTPAVLLVTSSSKKPHSISLNGKAIETYDYAGKDGLIRIRFENESFPRRLEIRF
jgi:hypothetical protein